MLYDRIREKEGYEKKHDMEINQDMKKLGYGNIP